MNNEIYWLWLTLKSELNHKDISALLDKFGNAKEIYNADDLDGICNISDDTVKSVMNKSLANAYEVQAKIRHMDGYIVTIEDSEYPELLKSIYNPPLVLYMLGEHMDWENLLTITIVGSRTYNDYGRKVTEHIAGDLAKRGITIVSGMARGIDSIAGGEALKSGGKTVAVLGSGLDVIYPPENRELYQRIKENGVIITEYPPGTRPLRENFPRRNRIMAGLSYGVLITQAPKKSGALITASYAVENGRDVFSIPADIFMLESEGSNALLSQGARAVMSAQDIIDEYPYFNFEILDKSENNENKENKLDKIDFSSLNELQIKIVKCLNNESCHIDELSREIGIASFEIDAELVMLELIGIVRKLSGNIYELA